MCEKGDYCKIPRPKHLTRLNPKDEPISIDSCLADVMKTLWKNKVYTQSCCCGHGKTPPFIMVTERHSDTEIKEIYSIIDRVSPGNTITISQWRCKRIDRNGKEQCQN